MHNWCGPWAVTGGSAPPAGRPTQAGPSFHTAAALHRAWRRDWLGGSHLLLWLAARFHACACFHGGTQADRQADRQLRKLGRRRAFLVGGQHSDPRTLRSPWQDARAPPLPTQHDSSSPSRRLPSTVMGSVCGSASPPHCSAHLHRRLAGHSRGVAAPPGFVSEPRAPHCTRTHTLLAPTLGHPGCSAAWPSLECMPWAGFNV